jgi:hypothetical protein
MAQRTSSSKRIAPGAYDALVEALSIIFWNKAPFERFLRVTLRDHPELLSGLTFSGLKRQVASDLVMTLAAREDKYQAVTLSLMFEVAAMNEFSNLSQQPDRPELVSAAQTTVTALRKWTEQYGALAAAQEQLRNEDALAEARYEAQRSVKRVLNEQKELFLALHQESNEQLRGRLLESLLNELFFLFDMNPRRSFVLCDEQIDGAFTFNTDDYLLEAKWEKTAAARRDVDVLAEVVRRKGKNALGLFVAIGGFSAPAINAHSNCGTGLMFMDGADLYSVLDGHISLIDVLEAKRRHLSETGLPLHLVKDMLSV